MFLFLTLQALIEDLNYLLANQNYKLADSVYVIRLSIRLVWEVNCNTAV